MREHASPGKRLAPKRAPAKRFQELTQAETRRLESITRGIATFQGAIERFGLRDSDFNPGLTTTQPETVDQGPTTELLRALVYNQLSETAAVRVTQRVDGTARITFEGKRIVVLLDGSG